MKTSTIAYGSFVTTLALLASACAAGGSGLAAMPTQPSDPPALKVAISRSTSRSAQPQAPFVGIICSFPTLASLGLDVSMTAFDTVDLQQVDLVQMIDGTHLGGPRVTFPQGVLSSQFGTTVIVVGSTRVFTFLPQFLCGVLTPQFITADVVFADLKGVRHSTTGTMPLR